MNNAQASKLRRMVGLRSRLTQDERAFIDRLVSAGEAVALSPEDNSRLHMIALTHSTSAQYTKSRSLSFSQQIRNYLSRHGASTAAEIRHGIAKDKEAARCLTIEVSANLFRMAKAGQVVREKLAHTSYFSIAQGREDGRRLSPISGGLRAKRALDSMRSLVSNMPPDIRAEVLSEMYLRVACGMDDYAHPKKLRDSCRKYINKQITGGYKENYSVDLDLTGEGFSLLDTITDYDFYSLDERVGEIQRLARLGYHPDSYQHLFDSTVSYRWHR